MDYLKAFVCWVAELLSEIPGSTWGVLLGSGLTLVGLWITGKMSSAEKIRERTQQLRRDIYLPAAEATVEMFSALGHMINLTVSDEDAVGINQKFSIAVARVQLVASTDTIRAFGALQRAVLQELAQVQTNIHPMRLRKSDLNIAAHWRDTYQAERSRLLELKGAYNLEGKNDPARWNALDNQYKFADEQCEKHSQQWAELSLKQFEEQVEVLTAFVSRFDSLLVVQTRALVAIRNELEFDGAETVLLDELRATAVAAKQSFELMLGNAKSVMEDLRRSEADDDVTGQDTRPRD